MAADGELPVGTSPVPVAIAHFPSRVHTFVWRNWQVVEQRKMAQVLDTTVENVAALAESMGRESPAAARPSPADHLPGLVG